VKDLVEALAEVSRKSDLQRDVLNEIKLEAERTNGRLLVLESSDNQHADAVERMVTQQLFEERTRAIARTLEGQNRILEDIAQRVPRRGSVGGMPIVREESEPPIPPMRPRLPSRGK
jgi:hypothetical protein